MCTSISVSENQHESDWQSVWPSGYHSYEDNDEDGLDDEWEVANPEFTPKHPNNDPQDPYNDWNSYLRKSEEYAKSVENNYTDKSTYKDWASPGTNWK